MQCREYSYPEFLPDDANNNKFENYLLIFPMTVGFTAAFRETKLNICYNRAKMAYF